MYLEISNDAVRVQEKEVPDFKILLELIEYFNKTYGEATFIYVRNRKDEAYKKIS